MDNVPLIGPTEKVTLEQKSEGANYMDNGGNGIPSGGKSKYRILRLTGTWSAGGLAEKSVWLE